MLSLVLDNHPLTRLFVFLAVALAVGLWEVARPCRPLSLSRLYRWANNWSLSALNSVVLGLVFPVLGVGVALIAAENAWGLFNAMQIPAVLAIPLFILLFDLAIYWQHRIFHMVPALWRLHRVHHADPDIDLSTGIRFHPLSIILSMLIKFAVILLLGPPPVAVLLAEIILNATSLFNHGNIALPPRMDASLRLLVVTPDMHRVHHSVEADESNSNFGFNFPWWDRLFGSYRAQPRGGHQGMEVGVRGFHQRRAQRLDQLLMHPIKRASVD